jgi:hypothetical protein
MKRRSRTIGWLLSVLLAGAGCAKSGDTAGSATTKPAGASPAKTSITPAPVAASTVAAAAAGTRDAVTANVSAGPESAPAAAGSPMAASAASATPVAAAGGPASAAAPAAAAESPEMARKRAQIEWALKQDEIKNDPHGQWATQANGSSAYNDAKGNAPYAPGQATGPATIEGYGNNALAWNPKTPGAGIEWLDLQYAKPVYASAVRVRENYGSGAVIKIEVFDEKGAAHMVWSGTDPTKDLNYLVAEFPKTAFKTGRVKLTLATNIVPGANEIDAVQLVGTDQ